MANGTITSTYEGQAALPFVAPAILSADTLANGYISVLDNVRFKANLRKVDNVTVAARSCEFTTPTTGIAISDVVLETVQLQVNEQLCNKDLAESWAAEQMRGNYAGMPGDYANYLGQYVAAKVAANVEQNIWQGNYDSNGTGAGGAVVTQFTGIMKHVVDATPTHENLVTAAFSSTNIATNLATLVGDLPSAIIGDPDAVIYMSRKSFQLYYQFLAANNNNPVLAAAVANSYLGYEIITPAGFPDDTLLLGKKDNFYFGTNLLTDHIEARFLDLTGTTGDAVTRIAMLFDGGTQVVDHDSYGVVRRSA
jgi:hypothetical protein